MKGARRTRNRKGAGFADLMAVPPQPRRGVITGMSRFQQHSNSTTPTATAQTTPSSSTPSTPRPSPADEDWDSLLTMSPRRRISPVKSKLGSRSRPASVSMDFIPPRTPKTPLFNLSSPRQSTPPLTSPAPRTPTEPPQPPPISPQKEPELAPSARSSLAPVPSFLTGWEGADGWGDDPLDESDPEVDEEPWGAWGDTADISIPEEISDHMVSDTAPISAIRPSASETIANGQPSETDATEQAVAATDISTHFSIPDQPVPDKANVDCESAVTIGDHEQQLEQKKEIEPDNHPVNDSMGESVIELDPSTADAINDGGSWGPQGKEGDLSVQPAIDISNALPSFEEPTEVKYVFEGVEETAKVSDAQNSWSLVQNGAAKHPTKDNPAEREGLEETKLEQRDTADVQIASVPYLTEQHQSEPEEHDGKTAVDGGVCGDEDGLKNTAVAAEDGSKSLEAREDGSEAALSEIIGETSFGPTERAEAPSTSESSKTAEEISHFDQHSDANDASTASEGHEENEKVRTDGNQSIIVDVSFEDVDHSSDKVRPVDKAGELKAEEGAWEGWMNNGDFPSEESQKRIVVENVPAYPEQSLSPAVSLQMEQDRESSAAIRDNEDEVQVPKPQGFPSEESPNVMDKENVEVEPKQPFPIAVCLPVEPERETASALRNHVDGNQLHTQPKTDSTSHGEGQISEQLETVIRLPGPASGEPDLTAFDIGPESGVQQVDSFDVQDNATEFDADMWGEWGDFEDIAVPQPQMESSTVMTKESSHDEAISEAKPAEDPETTAKHSDVGSRQRPESSTPALFEPQEQAYSSIEDVIGKEQGQNPICDGGVEDRTDQRALSAPMPDTFESSVRVNDTDEAVTKVKDESTQPEREVANQEIIVLDSTTDTDRAQRNDKCPSESECGRVSWKAFGDISVASEQNIDSSLHVKQGLALEPGDDFNINSSTTETVKSEAVGPDMMFFAEVSKADIQVGASVNTPSMTVGNSHQNHAPRHKENAMDPARLDGEARAVNLSGLANEEQVQVESTPSLRKELSNANTSFVPRKDDSSGPVDGREDAKYLTSSAPAQNRLPDDKTTLDVQEHAFLKSPDSSSVDAAFFGGGEAELIESIPLGKEHGTNEDDVWDGWGISEDAVIEKEVDVQNLSKQSEASSPASRILSEQPMEEDEKEAADVTNETHPDILQYFSGQGGFTSASNESNTPTAEFTNDRTRRDAESSIPTEAIDISKEDEPQEAFSKSFWTEKLNPACAQELDRIGLNSSTAVGSEAYVAQFSQHTGAAVDETPKAPHSEEHEADYHPLVSAEKDFPSEQPLAVRHVSNAPMDESSWYPEDIGIIEESKSTSDPNIETQPNETQPNGVYNPAHAPPQSEIRKNNECFDLPDVAQHLLPGDGVNASRSTAVPSETYDPFAPVDGAAETYEDSQHVSFEEVQEKQESGAAVSFKWTNTERRNDSPDFALSESRPRDPIFSEESSAGQEFSSFYTENLSSKNEELLSENQETKESIHESAEKVQSFPTVDHSPAHADLQLEGSDDSFLSRSQPDSQQHKSGHFGGPSPPLQQTGFEQEANVTLLEQTLSSFGLEQNRVQASTGNDMETNSYAPPIPGMVPEIGHTHQDSRLQSTTQHEQDIVSDSEVLGVHSHGIDHTASYQVVTSLGYDYQAYAPKPCQTSPAFVQKEQDSYASFFENGESGLIKSSQEISQVISPRKSDHQINHSNKNDLCSPMPEKDGNSEPYGPTPEEAAVVHSFLPQQDGIPEPYRPTPGEPAVVHSFVPQQAPTSEETLANFAPRQRIPSTSSGYAVNADVAPPLPFSTSLLEKGVTPQGAGGGQERHTKNESYTAAPFQTVSEDPLTVHWGEGIVEQKSEETSIVGSFPMSNEMHSANLNFQPYQPFPKGSVQGYETSSEFNVTKDNPALEPNASSLYQCEGYGNYTTPAPIVPEPHMESTYLDASMFSYPFSIMDTTPSGDMIHPGARPIMSWSFVGSFVTVFPSTQEDQVERTPVTQMNKESSHNVQVFDIRPFGADGANDEWIAAAEAVEPLAYPVQTSQLESYAKMCDELSQFSAGLSGPAAESRAALWRLLALLCRAGDKDWRRSASKVICGPTSVPLFGNRSGTITSSNHPDESFSCRTTEVGDRDATNEVERLLTEGRGADAVSFAKSSGLWSLALVLAGSIDRKLYKSILCDFAKETLAEGSALQTLCFSLSDNDSEITRRITSAAGLEDWRKNVSMLLTNWASISTDSEKRDRFLHLIDQVGDALSARSNDIVGSHVCYILSGRLKSLDRNGISLLGATSNVPCGRPKSLGSPAAILQSLVFEATGNARNGKTCPHILPFRFLLAQEIASVGRAEAALAHCNAISREVRAVFESENSIAGQIFTPPFLSSLESFEQQLLVHLGLEEKREKLTRLSALGKSLSSVFARSVKDQTQEHFSNGPRNQSVMANTQSFAPAPAMVPGHIHGSSEQIPIKQPPHLSLDSRQGGVLNSSHALENTSNDLVDQSTKKEQSGKEKWNYLVQKTVGLIAPADYDLSPPPPSRAPPPAFGHHGQPSPLGLDGGAGTRTPAQGLAPSHMRSASVGALPSEYFNNIHYTSNSATTNGQPLQSCEDERNISAPQLEVSAGRTDPALFNGVAVKEATRDANNDALVHRRSASDMTLQSQTSERRPPLHPKTPSKLTDTSTETPQQKKGWRERLREKLTAAFGGGPPRAHLGEENKFVFDKARGRWVIEGEDPEEEEEVPPPPPDDDNMFNSEGGNVQTSSSYDPLPSLVQTGQTPALLRSQSAQDARDPNLNISNSHNPVPMPFNPLSSYPGSLDNSVGGDEGSATSVASAASAPVPYSATPSFSTSSAGNSNQYRVGGGRRPGRRAYVDTFNKGRPAAPVSAIPTPARPAVPAFRGMTSASGGGYKIFTPTPVPSTSTGNSDTGHGANSTASVVETSDQKSTSASDMSYTQKVPTTTSSHSDALPPKPPSRTSSFGSGRQPRMMA